MLVVGEVQLITVELQDQEAVVEAVGVQTVQVHQELQTQVAVVEVQKDQEEVLQEVVVEKELLYLVY
jgi:hypothetical protein